MTFNSSWSPENKARYFRLQNRIAERALTRGRKWTAREQLQHLAEFMAEESATPPSSASIQEQEKTT